jgi:hypothetical protein
MGCMMKLNAAGMLMTVFLIAQPVMAQVVINRDGSFPAPSVSTADYPKLVDCTLKKRATDIEALMAAQRRFFMVSWSEGKLGATEAEYDALLVQTADNRSVEANRLSVEIIETCHELKEGYPLGFWMHTLFRDWGTRMAIDPYAQPFDSEQFARCLVTFRPLLVDRYLSEKSGSGSATVIYSDFFKQEVCKLMFPLSIKEKRVRKIMTQLRDGSDT